MDRTLMDKLVEWKNSPYRKPLLLKGARQVGKTWLMKEFGRRYFKKTAYINFDHNSRMQQAFAGDFNIERLLLALGVESHTVITPGDTLILFDEVQEVPEAISALKYFCENAPEYPVIAAGSLLGVAIHEGVSFPVGKVDILQLFPLSFYEFLAAVGQDNLAVLLKKGDLQTARIFHDSLVFWLKNYYYVGGMPEAVSRFAATKDYAAVRRLQKNLTSLYEADFSKHIDSGELERVRMVWNAVPVQLSKENKKFFFGQVKKGARSKEFEIAIQWLIDCGLITRVNRVKKPAMPLKAYEETNAYKLFFLDIGLLGALGDLDAVSILEGNQIFTEFKGALTEQYVCQQLITETEYTPYYFTSDSGKYELDFMIQSGQQVVPIEVKAESNVQAKSLRAYCDKYHPGKAVRISMNDFEQQDWVMNFPLYGMHCLAQYLK